MIMVFEEVREGDFKITCATKRCRRIIAKGRFIIIKGGFTLCFKVTCRKCHQTHFAPWLFNNKKEAEDYASRTIMFGKRIGEKFIPKNKFGIVFLPRP